MTPITITGYTAARNRLHELEDKYTAANPDDMTAGYYMDLVSGHDFGGEWYFVFSPTKYSDRLNVKARALLLKQAGQSHDNEKFGPYRGARSDEAIGA